ncbi:hypothetical protein diail_2147 [Diaporthe ilicicola]|nr:hypothetical protein diail_2147 [Diaporthe ilicicola]
MADPLSLAASLAGLVSLADSVFRHVYRYVRGVSAAKEEISNIAQELQSLTGVLRSIQALAEGLEEDGNTYDPAIRVHHVYHCEQTLNKIHDRMKRAVQKVEKSRSRDGIMQQLKWPFSKSETLEVLEELERHKSTMNLGIGTDSMHKMQMLLSKQKETDVVVSETRQVVHELRTEILVDAKKRRVLEFFMDTAKVNPQTSLDTNIKIRHPMTGLWLTESPVFIQWLDTPGSNIWLSGIPGGGKTVLAGAVTQETLTHASQSPELGAAFFFCDYKNEETLKSTNIIGALASQLARQKDKAFDLLQEYYDDLHPVDSLPKKADSDDLRALVGKMCELFNQVSVVIDGVDECGDGMDEVAEMLSDLASNSSVMSMAIFSRYNVAISRQIGDDFKLISIEARSHDIELYVRAELESLVNRGRLRITNASLKDDIRDALVDQAQGMFRWVACQLDYLCGFSSDFERRKALGHLPPTLHETYLRLLQRFSALPHETQFKIQMCLDFIAFSPEKLSINQLRAAISTPELVGSALSDDNMVSEEDIEFMCGSLLRKSDNGMFFEFAHFSVREFLEHESLAGIPSLKQYQICPERSNRMLAAQSLRFLQLSNLELEIPDPSSLLEHEAAVRHDDILGEFYSLSAKLSLRLSSSEKLDPISADLMKSLFHPRKSSCFVLFVTQVCFSLQTYFFLNGMLETNEERRFELAKLFLYDDFRPIHFAAALNLPEVCSHLMDIGSDPKARCAFGTPLELTITSFLRFTIDICDVNKEQLERDYQCIYNPVQILLGTSKRRNSTFDMFEHLRMEQVAPGESSLPQPSYLLRQAILIAFIQNDFIVLRNLLCGGLTLDDTICVELFGKLMHLSASATQSDDRPLLCFLQYIGSVLGPDPGWQLEIGRLIWNTAVKLDLSFTQDPTVTDSRISLSRDALVSRALTSIKTKDLQGLQKCLADGRLDLSERYQDTEAEHTDKVTLLHFAVLEDNVEAVTHLAKVGCDPNMTAIRLGRESPPIHDCGSIEVFEELLAHGAQATVVDTRTGETIWHFYVPKTEPETGFFEDLAARYPSETANSLLTKAKDGATPLEGILGSDLEAESADKALALIAICQGLGDFWPRHDPLLGIAAEFGSERVIRRLIEVGGRIDEIGPNFETPLHRLSIHISSGSVQFLKPLYPGALNMRFEGKLPLQLYIEKCSYHNEPIISEVAQELLTDQALVSIDGNGTTLWEYCCNFNPIGIDDNDQSINKPLALLGWLLGNVSALKEYDKRYGKSGLILILARFVALDVTEDLTSIISPRALSHAIDATDCWASAKNDPDVLRFLQFVINNCSHILVSVLVEHGVSVQKQVDGYSSVQIAFESPLVLSFCSDEEGKDILRNMLDHASPEHLNDYGKDGLTILHRLSTSDSDPDADQKLEWLIKTLVEKGADMNKLHGFGWGYTPMAYHLSESSVFSAAYLLDLGADPGLASDGWQDAACAAALTGSTTFLKKLYEFLKKSEMTVNWGRTSTVWGEYKQGSDIRMDGVNAIHCASMLESLDALKFYVDHGLIDDLEATSAEGWTAMHCAAWRGCPLTVEYLSSKGCKVTSETENHSTPLHLSVQQGNFKTTQTLVRLGAKDVPDATGMTPSMYASRSNNRPICQLLSVTLMPESHIQQQPAGNLLPRKRLKTLTNALSEAIKSDDIKECMRLCANGCPICQHNGRVTFDACA